jgi:tryptophan 2,3-dioxygenase
MEKAVAIKQLKEKSSTFEYWMSKPVSERLAAIEMLRQQYIKFKYKDVQPRLQRVCRIIKQK